MSFKFGSKRIGMLLDLILRNGFQVLMLYKFRHDFSSFGPKKDDFVQWKWILNFEQQSGNSRFCIIAQATKVVLERLPFVLDLGSSEQKLARA